MRKGRRIRITLIQLVVGKCLNKRQQVVQVSCFYKEKLTKNETFKILAMSWQIEEKLKLDNLSIY